MQSIRDLFFAHRGKCSDKWENYLDVYDAELPTYRQRGAPVSLLEIGVQDGGSLEIWKKALPAGSEIVGIDIDPRVGNLLYPPGITVIVGNGADDHTLQTLLRDRQFDLIIDDGSHISAEIISTFELLFSRVVPGGLYIIEDLACSYRSASGGGLRHPSAANEWLKRLVDVVNGDHWALEETGPEDLLLRKTYGPWIDRVTFYDGIAVIAKRRRAKSSPSRRVLTGQMESQSFHIELFSAIYAQAPEAYRFSEAFAAKVIQNLSKQIEALKKTNAASVQSKAAEAPEGEPGPVDPSPTRAEPAAAATSHIEVPSPLPFAPAAPTANAQSDAPQTVGRPTDEPPLDSSHHKQHDDDQQDKSEAAAEGASAIVPGPPAIAATPGQQHDDDDDDQKRHDDLQQRSS